MSDLRFARELGAEFERVARARAVSSQRPGSRALGGAIGRIGTAVAIVIPVVIAVLAIALLSHSRTGGQHVPTSPRSGQPFGLSGGNCRVPARAAPHLPTGGAGVAPDGLIRGGSGRVSGIVWQLRVKEALLPGAIEHGRLILGDHSYGLCSRLSVPVAFGLINSGSHGIIYGYVATGGEYRITISAGHSRLTTNVQDGSFFIRALPRSACAYPALSVTATTPPVGGLPPSISRSLNENAPRFTTTLRFGACRAHRLLTVTSARGQSQGRSPDAALAHVTAQLSLVPPPGSHSHARGMVQELAHAGHTGVSLLAVGLSPGRYRVWLLGPHAPVALAVATVTHELRGAYDLPADAGRGSQIAVAHQAPGRPNTPGPIVLQAKLR